MHVYMTHCQRECKCSFCPDQILAGEGMVVGKMPIKGTNWHKTLRWHPQCWIKQGEVFLESRPYVPSHRGRVPLALDAETKALRFAVLRRYASAMQRINRIIAKHEEGEGVSSNDMQKLAHLGDMVDGLKTEIEPLGGVPKSWQ